MGILTIQNDFTHGEVSRSMVGRSDIELYKKTAKKLRNMLVIPTGGAKRRFGTSIVGKIIAREDIYQIAQFLYTEDEAYLLVISFSGIQIYLNDVLVAAIPRAPVTGTPWVENEIQQVRFAQTTNLMIFVHPNHAPRQLSRGANSSTWNFGVVQFSFVPAFVFSNNYDFQSFTLSNNAVGNATLTVTAGTFSFTDAFVGGIFIAPGLTLSEPIGFARIISRNSSTQVDVQITAAFRGNGSTTFSGRDCTVAERAWSDLLSDGSGNRGWPQTVAFHQGRLWFGGSRSLPQHLFGSQVGDYIDFETGVGLDSEAIIVELASETINNIKHLVPGRGLQVFTFSSEWTASQLTTDPLTPSNISILSRQTNRGTTNVEPVELDNVTFFVKRGGKGVMAYSFANAQESYNSEDISVISNDLIRDPIDSSVLTGSLTEDADFLLLCNSDGTLATYQTLRSQNVSAWSLSDTVTTVFDEETQSAANTPAKFKRVTAVGDDLYFVIEREVNGNTINFIEKISFDLYTDATISQEFGSPVSTVSNLNDLEGQYVQVIADGFVQENKIVTNGQITLDEPASIISVGIGFNWEIGILPITEIGPEGPATFVPKRINRAFIRFIDSLGIRVNGILVKNYGFNDIFNDNTLENTGPPQSGVETIRLQNWEIDTDVTISGDKPLPATILAIGFEVNT